MLTHAMFWRFQRHHLRWDGWTTPPPKWKKNPLAKVKEIVNIWHPMSMYLEWAQNCTFWLHWQCQGQRWKSFNYSYSMVRFLNHTSNEHNEGLGAYSPVHNINLLILWLLFSYSFGKHKSNAKKHLLSLCAVVAVRESVCVCWYQELDTLWRSLKVYNCIWETMLICMLCMYLKTKSSNDNNKPCVS